jgi:Tfp pilus assembly protein PilX
MTRHRHNQRGSALITVLVIVMVLGFTVVGIVGVGARNQLLSVHRISTARAFYAAEAGMNMAMRELVLGQDDDGDGTIGGISDDANAANNPAIGGGRVYVSVDSTGGRYILVSHGTSGSSRRRIEVELSTN